MAKRPVTRRKLTRALKPKPAISRYEFAKLCAQLAAVESLASRNRIDLDIQLRRIAQLQDEVDALKDTRHAVPSGSRSGPTTKAGL
jgi:hypothetical protein